MSKMESLIKSEIVRLAKREVRKMSVPLRRDVWLLKSVVSEIRKSISLLERFAAVKTKELKRGRASVEASDEEVKASRFSPRLIRSLRKRLGISQKELAVLVGVTVGAAHLWEAGKFMPRDEKKRVLVALRKLNRSEVREFLKEKRPA